MNAGVAKLTLFPVLRKQEAAIRRSDRRLCFLPAMDNVLSAAFEVPY
jgi:hypothetical protein